MALQFLPFWDADERGYEGPLYAANEWDRCWIGSVQLPGVVETSGASTIAVKKSRASGKHGARLTTTGKNPQAAEVKIYIWTPEQWEKWQEILPQIYGADRTESQAFDIYSPQLAMIGIKSVVVTSVSSPLPGRVRGERMISMRVEELAPVKATATKTHKHAKESAPPPLETVFRNENGDPQFTPENKLQSLPSDDALMSQP